MGGRFGRVESLQTLDEVLDAPGPHIYEFLSAFIFATLDEFVDFAHAVPAGIFAFFPFPGQPVFVFI